MSRKIDSVVIVRFDERGEQTYHVAGENVALFIIDERAKGDRVYEWLSRDSPDGIKAIMADDPIGSSQDERHKAIKNMVEAHLEGRSRFKIVETIDQ